MFTQKEGSNITKPKGYLKRELAVKMRAGANIQLTSMNFSKAETLHSIHALTQLRVLLNNPTPS